MEHFWAEESHSVHLTIRQVLPYGSKDEMVESSLTSFQYRCRRMETNYENMAIRCIVLKVIEYFVMCKLKPYLVAVPTYLLQLNNISRYTFDHSRSENWKNLTNQLCLPCESNFTECHLTEQENETDSIFPFVCYQDKHLEIQIFRTPNNYHFVNSTLSRSSSELLYIILRDFLLFDGNFRYYLSSWGSFFAHLVCVINVFFTNSTIVWACEPYNFCKSIRSLFH